MDAEFLAELDKDLTEVGLDEVWKREVGGRIVWISPVPFDGQGVINERMTDETLGVNFAFETKRLTMSYAIAGFGNKDLRPFRTKGPIFPITDREGKTVKVTLQKYIYEKMAVWGDPWIDAVFDVFADLMETHKVETLEKIEFKNNKEPLDELTELELRAGMLREQMGMPQMTEVGSEAARTEEPDGEGPVGPQEPSPEPPDVNGPTGPPEEPRLDFDPFEKIEEGPVGPQEPAPAAPPGLNGPAGPSTEGAQTEAGKAYRRTQEPPQELPAPVQSVPVPRPQQQEVGSPIQRAMAKRAGQQVQAQVPAPQSHQAILDGQDPSKRKRQPMHSSKDKPLQGQPSVQAETVEQQAERKVVPPPRVNPGSRGQSQNPRFSGSRR